MGRNVFENNQPEVSREEALELGDAVNSVLPTLAEGYHYKLVKLSSGKTAVVVEEGDESSPPTDVSEPKRDRFGRHIAG